MSDGITSTYQQRAKRRRRAPLVSAPTTQNPTAQTDAGRQKRAETQLRQNADTRNHATDIETTRRTLAPEALGKHVDLLARAVKINHDTARQNDDLAAKLKDATTEAETANRGLRQIASRIETHAGRSKWDFATLAAGMAIAALLAGDGAVYFTKQQLDNANFQDAINLIQNDKHAFWCGRAQASMRLATHQANPLCAIQMEGHQGR